MENYFMLDGKKVIMSAETVASLRKAKKNINMITKFPTENNDDVVINHSWALSLFSEDDKDRGTPQGVRKSGHGANLYLATCDGSWFDDNGCKISGYLYYKPED